MLNVELSIVSLQNLFPLIHIFPKRLFLLLPVPQSYASHSKTSINGVARENPQCAFSESGTAEDC